MLPRRLIPLTQIIRLSGSYHFDNRQDARYSQPSRVDWPRPESLHRTNTDPSHYARYADELNTFEYLKTTHTTLRNDYGYNNNSDRKTSVASSSITDMAAAQMQPNISLPDTDNAGYYDYYPSTNPTDEPPKSPGRFTNLFRWGSTSEQGGQQNGLSSQDHRSSALSLSLSPKSPVPVMKYAPAAIDVSRANAMDDGSASDSGISLPPYYSSSIEALEEEVRIVSADLALSIRREMDLEDLVERLQAEADERGTSEGRRTSDYFSDAGTPVRVLDSPASKQIVDAERVIRQSEQEKAQLRLELLGKVQEERERRKVAEAHAKELEGQAALVRVRLSCGIDLLADLK